MISICIIFFLLTLESLALNYIPYYAPPFLYATITAVVYYCFYGAPWMTFKFMEKEPFYLKSAREKIYMSRLVMQQLSVVVLIPFIYNYMLVKWSPTGYRSKPSSQNAGQVVLEVPKFYNTTFTTGPISMLSLISNEQYKDTISYAEEYFIRFLA